MTPLLTLTLAVLAADPPAETPRKGVAAGSGDAGQASPVGGGRSGPPVR